MPFKKKEKIYQVQTVFPFEAPVRRRAGIEVPAREHGPERYVGPLTAEQLAEIKEDRYLVVTELDAKGNPVTPDEPAEGQDEGSEGDEGSQDEGGLDATDAAEEDAPSTEV